MKKILIIFVTLFFLSDSPASAQFWGGFMQGMANAMQQQQMYYQQQLQQQYFPQNTSRTSRQSKEPVVETTKIEDDGFVWIKLRQWNPSKEEHIYGAKDENGKVIIL